MFLHAFFADIDECEMGANLCSENCYNNNGSYACGCDVGHALNDDGYSCDGK